VFTKRVRPERGRLLVLSALAVFCLLAAMPVILPLIHLQLHPRAATSSHGVKLLPAPAAPQPVSLPPVARPIDPAEPPAAMTTASAAMEVAAVSAEDSRIRTMLHDASHLFEPEVIPTRGALPTLVLTAGQGEYTSADLVEYGAMVRLPDHAALLLDNVFVAANARLSLGSSALRTLYLDNGSGGFASIVAWGGDLAFHGSAGMPLTIVGWDRTASQPAADSGSGRSYIREVGGQMTLSDVRASSLGFWSGRTGGIAWTGLSGDPSTGGATNSTFTDCSYGAFVSRGSDVRFSDDLFEFNQLDGLHIHRYSIGTSVVDSSASRNGGSGFVVSPATQNTELVGDVSEHNSGDGFFIDGRPLATGASASGGAVTPGSGTTVKDSAVLDNGKIGILVEGGTGTVIEGDQVCAQVTAVAVRYGVTGGVLTGNDIRCSPRSGLSIGPDTPGLVISGNTIVGPRTGILVSSAGPVQVDSNDIVGATVFGISARGAASKVTGVADTISGTGFRAIDARADAPMPAMSSSNVSAWASHNRVTFLSYLQFHPLAALWLSIAILVLLGWAWSHRHKLPSHPYPATTRWRAEMPDAPASRTALASSSAEPPLASVSTLRPVPALTADARDAEATQPLRAVDAAAWSGRAPRHPHAPAGSVPTVIRSTQWWQRTREEG
jgi:Right handed beta helix region